MRVGKNNLMVKNLDRVIPLTEKYDWEIIDLQSMIGMLSLEKKILMDKVLVKVRVNIYLTTLSVSTAMKHPKKGKTQLHRKASCFEDIEKILKNPRVHTGKGYYKKKK